MLLTPEFWVAVAFFAFVALVAYLGGFGQFLGGLDSRAKRIRAELDEARRLRDEAARILADYQRRRSEAEREVESIVAGAREEAERNSAEAHARLTEFVARRTAAAEAKIAQAERQAEADVRAAAADAAVKVSETILRERLGGEAAQDLVRRSLGEVRTGLRA